jgi:hypothetical protein
MAASVRLDSRGALLNSTSYETVALPLSDAGEDGAERKVVGAER